MNRKKLLTGPYFFWAVAFILIPLAMVLYYGLTDVDGHLTYENLLAIGTVENFKALCLSLLLLYCQHSHLSVVSLPPCHDFIRHEGESDQFYRVDLHPSHVDELSAAHYGVADFAGEKRRDQSVFKFSSPALHPAHQYALRHHTGHGVQLPALYGAAAVQCSVQD